MKLLTNFLMYDYCMFILFFMGNHLCLIKWPTLGVINNLVIVLGSFKCVQFSTVYHN